MKKLLFTAFLGAMCFVGCQKDDDANFVSKEINQKSNDGFQLDPKEEMEIQENIKILVAKDVLIYATSEVLCSGGNYLNWWKIIKTTTPNGTIVIHKVSGTGMTVDAGDYAYEETWITKITLVSINPLFDPC